MNRSTQRSLCAGMLTLQAVVLFLTTPVMISVVDVDVSTAVSVGLGLTVACVLTAGLLRHAWAYLLGWAVQVASIALGFVIPMMFFLGVVFAGLWAAAYFLGAKVDREKAERAGLEERWQAEHPT
jgi:Protein of unknown function (DUF4233)